MKRYETLDTLRGVAALAVVLYHLGELKMQNVLVPHGYLAVDFFFVLSGFVIACAYSGSLGRKLSWRQFVARRLVRLYPLALVGAVAGFVVLLLKWHSAPDRVDPLPIIMLSGCLNSLMLPTFFGGAASRYELFPGNGPLWSLSFELLINLVWAAWNFQRRTQSFIALTALSGMTVIAFGSYYDTLNLGFNVSTFWGGLARVCFGFPLGVLLFHFRRYIPDSAFRLGPIFLAIVLLGAMAVPADAFGLGRGRWDMFCVLFLLPAVVVIGTAQGSSGRPGVLFGELSYPVYVLHLPILALASALHQTSLYWVDVNILSAASVVLICVLSLMALRLYDLPIRRLLSRRLLA